MFVVMEGPEVAVACLYRSSKPSAGWGEAPSSKQVTAETGHSKQGEWKQPWQKPIILCLHASNFAQYFGKGDVEDLGYRRALGEQ